MERLEEKCSITSQLDFLSAGVSPGEGEARAAAGVLRPDSSADRTAPAPPLFARSEAQRRPRSASCATTNCEIHKVFLV